MKVVIAIDSLKGSMTSMEAGRAIRDGILAADPSTEVLVKPLADGGEGTTEALVEGLGGELVYVDVHGPLETQVKAAYGLLRETKTAIMEMAAASGIIIVGKDLRPLDATTYGVGEMIKDAIEKGCRNFIIGIGGSATNDGGIGMLTALGWEFLDKDGNAVGIGAGALKDVVSIKSDNVAPELEECSFKIACDVNNPLCGPKGATYIYGPQKGVTDDIKADLDAAMAAYAEVVKRDIGTDFAGTEGAGAAGGLGFAFLSFLKADLQPGIDLVLDAVEMEKAMEGADLVITGEGRLDEQTAMGKGPVGIAKLGKKHGAKTVALAGALKDGCEACNAAGIDAYFPIIRKIITLDEAMDGAIAKVNMTKTAEQVFRLVKAFSK